MAADDAQQELNQVLPALAAAQKALNALNKNDIIEIKTFIKPPALVQLTMEGVCILLQASIQHILLPAETMCSWHIPLHLYTARQPWSMLCNGSCCIPVCKAIHRVDSALCVQRQCAAVLVWPRIWCTTRSCRDNRNLLQQWAWAGKHLE